MNEINFFETKKKKIQINFDKKNLKYLIPIPLIILLVFYIVPKSIVAEKTKEVEKLESDILIMASKVNPPIDDNKDVLDLKIETIEQIEMISGLSTVSSDILEAVQISVPSSLFLNDLTVVNGQLTITGYAKSPNTIARFQNNLESQSIISDVFVSDIVKELGSYNFKLTANVGSF